ncbi:unnamed protein product, partial [Prunus brigantina]
VEGSHNFFVRLLTKDSWLDDSQPFYVDIHMALLLLRERHKNCGKWKCDALDYMQIKAYMGKEDRQHINGKLGMVKGEGPKLAKSWSSVNHFFCPLTYKGRSTRSYLLSI